MIKYYTGPPWEAGVGECKEDGASTFPVKDQRNRYKAPYFML